jgi:sugar-specific transcriptional regulator TrmB
MAPAIDPAVKKYLDDFRQSIESRYNTLEREASNLRRNLPAGSAVEFASDQASNAFNGVVEVRRELNQFKADISAAINKLGADLSAKIWAAMAKANGRARLWVAFIAAAGLIVVATITLVDHNSSATARAAAAAVCDERIDKAELRNEGRDRRLAKEGALEYAQLVAHQMDTIKSSK